jgi:ABC-2 type transport system permease protein
MAHELKLNLRAVTGRRGGVRNLIIVGALIVLGTLFVGAPLAQRLRHIQVQDSAYFNIAFDLAILVIFTLILSQTLAAATLAFYERGDLDLLLSSPIPSGRVLTVRAVGIAATPFLFFALFLTPVVAPLAVMGQPRWLADYLVLAAVALLAAAAGLSLAMTLFKLIGARATRTVGQLLAAVIGAAFFLISQSRYVLPDEGRRVFSGLVAWAARGAFAPGALLSWPARAAMGEPLPLLVFIAASVLIFAGVARGLGRRFAADASAASGVGSGPVRASTRGVTLSGFGGGVFTTLVRKELRLLARDPTLLSQVLLRTLYVIPMTLILVRNASRHGAPAPGLTSAVTLAAGAGAVTFMAGQVAGSLAWITISAEDAPELLACAPVDGGLVRRAKLAATMIPVAILLAVPLAALLVLTPWIGVCAIFGAAAAGASSGLVNLWFEKPAPRKAFRSRRGGSAIGAVAELALGLGWAVTAAAAAMVSVWALIPAGATLVAMLGLYALAKPERAY